MCSPGAQLSGASPAKDDLIARATVVGVAPVFGYMRARFMAYTSIIVEIDEDVALIRLNRPDALNALNSELLSELCDALVEADGNEKVRAIVLTGSDKAFAAGADIKEMADMTYAQVTDADLFGREARVFASIRKPIIAAVSGYALGGGCELAMMCDIMIASDTAKFGQPEVNIGVMPGLGGTQRLTQAIGKSKAMDMNLTGRFMDAEEAERAGLVSRVVPTKKLVNEAISIARKIAEKSAHSVRTIKEAVNRSFDLPLSEGLLFERRVFHALFATEDQTEGMSAFLDKREPQFRDK